MNTRSLIKTDWPAWLVMLLPFVVVALVWDRLPDELPMHWNASGEIDRYEAKGWNVLLLPLISVGTYLLMLAVPWIDPKRKTEASQKGIRAFRFIMPILLTAIFGIMCMNWLGFPFDMGRAIFLLISVLFLVIGNFLSALKPNYFIGIRTPWTLESAEIWRKTHRMSGRLWVGGSLVMIALWFVIPTTAYAGVFLTGTLLLAFTPVVYSLILYLQEKRAAKDNA